MTVIVPTGNSVPSLIPKKISQVDVHVGPIAQQTITGVLITLTEDKKYKVEGYNSVKRFFEIEESNKVNGRLTEVSVVNRLTMPTLIIQQIINKAQ